jgi:hypothetical protein
MSAARFRARLDRLDKIPACRTHADEAELPADHDCDRYIDLVRRQLTGGLRDTDQIELELLERRFPPASDNALDKAIMPSRAKHGQP